MTNGEWGIQQYANTVLQKMFRRPLTTKDLRNKVGHPQNVVRFREKNPNVITIDELPQLSYVKGWFDRIPMEERTPHDYILSRRLQLHDLELRSRRMIQTPETMLKVAGALRTLITMYDALATELEEKFAETNEEDAERTDGSVHSSEND